VEFGAARDVLTNPLHPYTCSLLESIPSVKIKWDRKQYVNADMETKEFQFTGCKFRNRCPLAQEICIHQRPLAVKKENGREVYCHFA
jgi:oligopeptide/dipeptide ABC transporter ATP-binding protein